MLRPLLGVLLAIAVAMPAVAGAELPPPPHRVYGAVLINGRVPADGTRVTAQIDGVACGWAVTAGGFYRLDVPATSPGRACGQAGRPVRFLVGHAGAPEAIMWEAARFTALDLSVMAGPYTTAALDMDSPCIPAAGRSGCDSARLRLWEGETEAWRLLFVALGAPPPSPDRVFDETVRLRLEAGDPATVSWFAGTLGWPYVRVTAIRFRGSPPGEADEFVEIANLGGGAQEMTGWRLRALGSGAEYRFRAGWSLAPGQRCRVYTGVAGPAACQGHGFGATFGLWDDNAGRVALLVDFPTMVADHTAYRAAPDEQLPPPALRGAIPAQ